MRGFLVGLVLIPVVIIAVLSIRPGGLRQQLRNAARRLRLALVLGGFYVVGATLIRIFVREGPVADFGPIAMALVAAAVFIVLGQDPRPPAWPPRHAGRTGPP